MTIFCFSFYLLTILYWDYKGLFPLTQLCKNAVPCKSTRHTHSALFDGKVFLLKKATCWRHVFRDKWKSSLWRCGSISRCSAVLDLLCVWAATSSLSNQPSWDFPNAVRDLHITGPVLVEVGIHWKKKGNVWLHFREIPDPPVGSAEREWNRQMYFNKVREPEVAFYSDWKHYSSHSSHVPLMMTDTPNGKGSLLRGILRR